MMNKYFMNHTVRFDEDSDVAYGAESRPMTLLNSYCGFECSPLNRLTANFFLVVGGCPAGVTSGYGHVFEQVFFDGKNHLYDLTHRTFFTSWDNETPASIAECEREPGLLCRPAAVGCCDNYIRLGARRPYYLADPDYPAKIGVTLNPGETFRVWWANDGNMNDLQMSNRAEKDRRRVAPEDDYTEICGAKTSGNRVWRIDRFFPMYGSGFIVRSGKPASVVCEMIPLFPDQSATLLPQLLPQQLVLRAKAIADAGNSLILNVFFTLTEAQINRRGLRDILLRIGDPVLDPDRGRGRRDGMKAVGPG